MLFILEYSRPIKLILDGNYAWINNFAVNVRGKYQISNQDFYFFGKWVYVYLDNLFTV